MKNQILEKEINYIFNFYFTFYLCDNKINNIIYYKEVKMSEPVRLGLDDPEIHARWQQAAKGNEKVRTKLTLSQPPGGILGLAVALAIILAFCSAAGFAPVRSVKPDGLVVEHGPADLAAGYTCVALAVTVLGVGGTFFVIAIKNRKQIAENPNLLDQLIEEQRQQENARDAEVR